MKLLKTLVSPWCKVIPPQLKGNCANKMVAKSGKVAIAALEQSHPPPELKHATSDPPAIPLGKTHNLN